LLTIGGTSQALILTDDHVSSAANITSVTSTGTTNTLELQDDDTDDANVDLSDGSITSFTSINFTGLADGDVILDAAAIVGTTTLIEDATDVDIQIEENGNYSNITLTAGDFDDLLIVGASATAVTLDQGWFGTGGTASIDLIDDSGANADPAVSIVMDGTSLDMSGVAQGTTNGVDITITGTTGNDTITLQDSKAAGSSSTVDGNGGNDAFRVSEGSGNATPTDTNQVLTIADAVTINNFDAANDQILVDISDVTGTGVNATVGTATVNTLNLDTTGAGFTFFTDSAVSDFASSAAVIGAVGTITSTDNDEFYFAVKNTSGSQVGVYSVLTNGANAGVALAAADGISLIAVINVTAGTFAVANIGTW